MIEVSFHGRQLIASKLYLGNEGDSGVEQIRFALPAIFEGGQTAYACYRRADQEGGMVLLGADGLWDVGAYLTGAPGVLEVFARIESGAGEVWHSDTLRFRVRDHFDLDAGALVPGEPDQLNQALALMSGYAGRAETAKTGAEAARTGAEAGQAAAEAARDQARDFSQAVEGVRATAVTLAPGEAATAGAQVAGGRLLIELGIPAGRDGQAGQSAYQAAQAGGYAGGQTEFYADLAAVEGLLAQLERI